MKNALLYPFRRFAMWLVWRGPPLGRFAPAIFDFAMGQKGRLVSKEEETKCPNQP